jgi:hypothetical protein
MARVRNMHMANGTGSAVNERDHHTLLSLAKRSAIFVLLFLICWASAVLALIWELAAGHIHPVCDPLTIHSLTSQFFFHLI